MELNYCLKSIHTVFIFIFAGLIFSSQCLAANPELKSGSGQKALTLGFFPIISTVALYKRFSPLVNYLSDELGRPIQLKTAKDFSTFFKRTLQREYDIVITAPHFAVKANDSKKYNIRTTLTSNVQQLVVVHKNSVITSINELSGAVIATPPEKALMTKMGKDLLRNAGLIGHRSPQYMSFNSHNAANEAVLAGEAVAAIASNNIVKKSLKKGVALKIIGKGLQFPNMATLFASDIDAETEASIIDILINMKKTDKGRATLKAIEFPGYRIIEAKDYEIVRPYL